MLDPALTTETLLVILARRGLRPALGADGQPVLKGPKDAATPALLAALKLPRHRTAILVKLRAGAGPLADPDIPDFTRPVECLWANGYCCPHSFPQAGWPVGAKWWRQVGDTQWRRIPGVPVSPLEPLGPAGRPVPSGRQGAVHPCGEYGDWL